MRILKYFLYLVLFFSVTWCILLFAGPAILKQIISSNTEGRVTIENVRVSPQLQVSIGRVYFSFNTLGDQPGSSGLAKSVNIKWSLFDDEAFLKITSGPTNLYDFGHFKSSEFTTPSFENLALKDLEVTAVIKGVVTQTLGSAAAINVKGFLQNDFSSLSELSVNLTEFKSADPSIALIKSMRGNVSAIKLDVPMIDQKLLLNLKSEHLYSEYFDLKAEELASEVNLEKGQTNFKVNLNKLTSQHLGGAIESLSAAGAYENGMIINLMKVTMLNGSFGDNRIKVAGIDVEIENNDSMEISATIDGVFQSSDLYAGGKFIGSLPPNDVRLNFYYNIPSGKVLANYELKFQNPEFSYISGLGELSGNLNKLIDSAECPFLGCGMSNLHLKYRINFDDESIIGKTSCMQTVCLEKGMSHRISTTNTKKIFNTLNKTRIINPLVSIYWYGTLTLGRQVGQGHEINLN